MRDLLIKLNKISILSLLIPLFFLISCSSEDGGGSTPGAAPKDLAVTGKSGELVIQFSKVLGMGTNKSQDVPVYEVEIAKRGDKGQDIDRVSLTSSGKEALPNDRLLMKITIKKELGEGEVHGKGNIFKYANLTDGQEYNIYIRSYFKANNIRSAFTHVVGLPIPKAKPLTNFKVETGDKRIVFSWDKNEFEEYFVGIDTDCPSNVTQAAKWNLSNLVVNKYRVFTVADNIQAHTYCAVASNVNGKGEWILKSDSKTVTGEAAKEAPDKPSITAEASNKKIVVKYNPVLVKESETTNKSVSKYSVMYKKATESNYTTEEIKIDTLMDDGSFSHTILGLQNGTAYNVKIKAENTITASSNPVESNEVTVTPEYIEPNFNDLDSAIGKAETAFVYAENVPHSDFWRIRESKKKGEAGRPDTDRLVRGKETAIGTLFSEGIKEYYNSKNPDKKVDFAFLIGDMINSGLSQNQNITPRVIKGILNSDYYDDVLYVYELKGSDIISGADLNIDLNSYPALSAGKVTSLLGQAASVYRNGHYGGSGGTFRNGKYWGLPSNELSYTIEYKKYMIPAHDGNSNQATEYTIEGFKKYFQSKCTNVNMDTYIDNTTSKPYDSKNDPNKCYILTYEQANPVQGDVTGKEDISYKRGKIQKDSVKINGVAIDSNKTYRVLTTSSIDKYYEVFIPKTPVDKTNVKLLDAINYYIYDKITLKASDYLTGKVKIVGGVPGDPNSDYKTQTVK